MHTLNTSNPNPFPALKDGDTIRLSGNDHFESAHHLWSEPEIHALTLAFAARRPLLVRGEAGVGKSQIARAAAQVLSGSQPLVEVIHPRFEALELLYRFDAIARLADAQLKDQRGRARLDATNRRYVQRGMLWQAFERAATGVTPVLLIDEIDKADADLPNALLDVLGNRSFNVPHLNHLRVQAPLGRMPLIVITTNEERELPAAFVRRCVVLNLAPPEDDAAFVAWLQERAGVHTALAGLDAEVLAEAARQVLADRRAAAEAGFPKVGLAEYLDLLNALAELTQTEPAEQRAAKQKDWLQRLSAYALIKNAGQSQRRPAQSPRQP
jgi:MoxR-like ATPase